LEKLEDRKDMQINQGGFRYSANSRYLLYLALNSSQGEQKPLFELNFAYCEASVMAI
jgi:hypothetical protein